MNEDRIEVARLLTSRLERLSVDSYWAHRASGLRGSLLRCLEQIEVESAADDPAGALRALEGLIEKGFAILERAAREIRTPDGK